MSEDYSALKPLMVWNTTMKWWERSTDDQLLPLSEPFLGTWQTSGTMRNGRVYELQTQEHLTSDSESSLLPTPITRDYKDGSAAQERDGKISTDTVARAIFNSGEVTLPTPTASDWKGANNSGSGSTSSVGLATKIDNLDTNWGKFEPAIRRWEKLLGRLAPAPTKPDGKEGGHRLSSSFTEWMMGLPEGWVTDCGLSRKEELKACGNGVVPQQAELALSILLKGVDFQSQLPKISMFPTPTVSDIFTDNLKSSQQKEGSMHSVTLPQAVRMVSAKIEEGQELTTLDPQTDSSGVGRVNSATLDRQ